VYRRGFREKGCSWEEGLWRCKQGRRIVHAHGPDDKLRSRRAQEVSDELRRSTCSSKRLACSGGIAWNTEFRRSTDQVSLNQWFKRKRGGGGASCAPKRHMLRQRH
jgi:hypothetical protein